MHEGKVVGGERRVGLRSGSQREQWHFSEMPEMLGLNFMVSMGSCSLFTDRCLAEICMPPSCSGGALGMRFERSMSGLSVCVEMFLDGVFQMYCSFVPRGIASGPKSDDLDDGEMGLGNVAGAIIADGDWSPIVCKGYGKLVYDGS